MSKSSCFILLVFLSVMQVRELQGNKFYLSRRYKKQAKNCNDRLRISGCSENQGNPTMLTEIDTVTLTSDYQTDCPYLTIKYKWRTDFKNWEEDEGLFSIEAAREGPGQYEVKLEIEVTTEDTGSNVFKAKCFLKVKVPGPEAIIEGGKERTVKPDRDFVVDGSKSIDIDKTPNESGRMVYSWSCSVLKGNVKDFCKRTFEGSTLTVPAQYVLEEYEYRFVLKIKVEGDSDWLAETSQLVRVEKSLKSELKIICEKNCPPKTVSKRETFLRVKCVTNCQGIDESSYEWTVEGASFDYQKWTKFGRNTDKFIIKEDVLVLGVKYKMRVSLTGGRKGSAEQTIEVSPSLKIESCSVDPPKGTATETKFKVDCKYSGSGQSFEVYTVKDGKSVPLAKTRKLEDLEFLLPANVEAFIKIEDQDGLSDTHKLNVQVTSAITPESNQTQEISRLTDTVKDLVRKDNIGMAIQVAMGLIEELDKRPVEEAKEIKRELLKEFVDAPIKSREEARQIYSLVTRLVHDPSAESDPYQGEMATRACRKGAEIDYSYLQNEYYQNMAKEIQDNAKILMSCGSTDTKENLKQFDKKRLKFTVTTPFPVLALPKIDEHYSDYDTDDIAADKRKKYEEASQNYVEICRTTLKMMALTVVEGEDTIVASSDVVSAQITRVVGKNLVGKEIKIQGALFRASKDLESVDDAIDVTVCSWEKDPFWWNPSGRVVSTNVVLVRVIKNEQELVTFEKPTHLVLDFHQSQNGSIEIHEIQDANMSVIRVDVRRGESFFVEFHNLTDSFRVSITDFDKPDVEDVQKKGRVVGGGTNQLYQEYERDYDSWHYISVLPESTTTEFKYRISVYTKSCYSWRIFRKEWDFACKGSSNTNNDNIECVCTHLSILAGVIYNNPIRVEKMLTSPDFEMVLISSPIIFICVAAVFALYCFALTIRVKKKIVETANIFIPADISSSSRYVYLVGIRTGRKPSSGTSANICVKLFGDKHKSQSHILNYPDPQRRILQWGGEDWFVLPTSHRLGDLTEIALWSDHSGRDPRWYCNNVVVYDLQSYQNWYFKVNTWFDLPPKGQIYARAQAAEMQKEKPFAAVLLRIIPKRTHQAEFSAFKRWTIVLSILMAIFLWCLLLSGPPRLVMSDGFAIFDRYDLYPEVIWIGLSSAAITFVMHMTCVSLFSNSGDQKKFSTSVTAICWVFLISKTILSMTILIVFGFWMPIVTGLLWLTSAGIAILVYFFVLENVYEIVSIIRYKRQDVKWMKNMKKILELIEVQRTYLFKKFGDGLLRQYFNHLYRPMDRDEIKEKNLRVESRFKILALLEDTIMFICYISLLYLAIFAHKNSMADLNHKEVENLVTGYYTRSDDILIESVDDFYDYVNITLIPMLHAQQWYSKYVVQEPGTMADFSNKFLGVARLRQQRAVLYPCMVPIEMGFLPSNYCRPEYKSAEESFESFGPEFNDLARLSQIWNYTHADDAGYSLTIGKFGLYPGGGFIAPLGRTLYNSYVNLNYLWENGWIDEATVVILVEFLAYNVNSNMFTAVRVVVERGATGFFRTKLDLISVQLLFVNNEDDVAEFVIFCAFCTIVIIFTMKILTRIWKGKLLVLRDLWTFVDLVIVGMSYGCFALFVHRAEAVKQFLERMEKAKKNEFINYFYLIYEETVFILVAALLVFVSTIRLWKLCRFGTVFRIMENTLGLCALPLTTIFLCHMIVVLAFSLCGYFIFGTISEDFEDVPDSLVALMRLTTRLVGHFNLDVLLHWSPVLGNIYYSAYMLSNLLFYNFYIVSIIPCYHKAQQIHSDEHEFVTLKRFLYKEMEYYKASMKIGLARLKGGGRRRRRFVTPKGDDFRYQNCITLPANTLEKMRCIAYHSLKKLRGKDKFELMCRIVRCSSEGGERDIFYSEKIRHNVIKIIHDDKVKRVAAAAELILDYDEKRKQKVVQRYKKSVENQKNKLKYIDEVLGTILNIVSNIEIE